ncbi:MAG: hypothetical protein NWE95_07080 [Candidatus Bathyarchaeota archaeon]|nr:hypothetical protein [Candidatus Bathyarchaeota archaeon]
MNDLKHSKILFLSYKDITIEPHLHGEDRYLFKLFAQLRANEINADICCLPENTIQVSPQGKMSSLKSYEEIVADYDVVLLHCVSPKMLLRAKFKSDFKLVMPVYFLWNKASSLTFNLKGLMGNLIWQPLISNYIVTSTRILDGLKKRGLFRKIYLIPPTYECKYCNKIENANKLKKLKKSLPQKIRAVYIGSLNEKRFSINDAVLKLREFGIKDCALDVYTNSSIKQGTYNFGNIIFNVRKKLLLDNEKCKVLSEAHLFIAPKPETTMDPSLSVMEAEYHGNIII